MSARRCGFGLPHQHSGGAASVILATPPQVVRMDGLGDGTVWEPHLAPLQHTRELVVLWASQCGQPKGAGLWGRSPARGAEPGAKWGEFTWPAVTPVASPSRLTALCQPERVWPHHSP